MSNDMALWTGSTRIDLVPPKGQAKSRLNRIVDGEIPISPANASNGTKPVEAVYLTKTRGWLPCTIMGLSRTKGGVWYASIMANGSTSTVYADRVKDKVSTLKKGTGRNWAEKFIRRELLFSGVDTVEDVVEDIRLQVEA
jgi:hypothetical protein